MRLALLLAAALVVLAALRHRPALTPEERVTLDEDEDGVVGMPTWPSLPPADYALMGTEYKALQSSSDEALTRRMN